LPVSAIRCAACWPVSRRPGQSAPDDHRRRLIEGGLIVERQGRIAARNGLYGRYFGRVLNA